MASVFLSPGADRPGRARADAEVALLLRLAHLLPEAGLPSHRVESMLLQVAERFGIALHVFVVPTNVWLSFQRGGDPATFMIRVVGSPVNLERLGRLHDVAQRVIDGRIPAGEALYQIEAIRAAPYRWNHAATIGGYVLSALAFSVFFDARVAEFVVGGVVGLAVGVLAVLMRRVRTQSRLFELVAATVAAFVACIPDSIIGAYEHWVPLAAGLIILLPGMSLVDSIEELAHGRFTAGGSRLAGVGVVFLAITFGGIVGSRLSEFVPAKEGFAQSKELYDWMPVVAVGLVAVGSTVRFRARPRDVGMVLVASAVAFVGSRWGATIAGSHLAGAFIAALALGLTANAFHWYTRMTPELVITPGLAVLVPGSFGVRSFELLMTESTIKGVDEAFQMFMVATALVAGLLFSNALVRDRGPS